MKCPRCGSKCIDEHIYDVTNTSWYTCKACGWAWDLDEVKEQDE